MNWSFVKITDICPDEYDAIYSSLSPSRRVHIDRMKHREDQLRSLAAQHLLTGLLGEAALSVTLENGADGKPYLAGSALCVSISHSGEGVVCAIDENAVGIDIEKIKDVPESLIHYVCTKEEESFVLGDPELSRENFFRIWTAKEAYLKKTGLGLKPVLATNTLALNKQVFLVEDYVITIL